MLKLDKMLLIGSDQRNVGKTTLACELINKYSKDYNIAAIKITPLSKKHPDHTVESDSDRWEKGYDIVREKENSGKTDTSKFFAAGAQQSFWLRVFDENLLEGFTSVLKEVGEDVIIICESTSLVKFIKPGVFIMITADSVSSKRKKHVQDLEPYASIRIWPDGGDFKGFVKKIRFKLGKWEFNTSNFS